MWLDPVHCNKLKLMLYNCLFNMETGTLFCSLNFLFICQRIQPISRRETFFNWAPIFSSYTFPECYLVKKLFMKNNHLQSDTHSQQIVKWSGTMIVLCVILMNVTVDWLLSRSHLSSFSYKLMLSWFITLSIVLLGFT